MITLLIIFYLAGAFLYYESIKEYGEKLSTGDKVWITLWFVCGVLGIIELIINFKTKK
jgi:hypothetical protein